MWAPRQTQQYISTQGLPTPFTSTASCPEGHPTLWVVPRTEGGPETLTSGFKSKTKQETPERVASPTPASPAGVRPSLGSSLHLLQSQQSEPSKMQIGSCNSAAYTFRTSPDCSLAPRPGHPVPLPHLLYYSSLPMLPAPCTGHHARPQAGLDQQSLWNLTSHTAPYPSL